MSTRPPSWRPMFIKRFIKAFPTSACTVLVETDAGKGYLKALGGTEAPDTLACEWVGTRLATWLGLSTFDFAIIPITELDEIPFHNGAKAQIGPAFITRAESGEPWSGGEDQLKKLANREDVSRLVVFDTWTLNCDRHSWPPEPKLGKPRMRRDNVFLSEEALEGQFVLKAMDHTHCFTCGKELKVDLRNIDKIRDERVFGLFPEFRNYLDRKQVRQAAIDLQKVDRADIVRWTREVPREWQVTSKALDALADLIVGRAAYVAATIEDRLWPQREIDFDKLRETEQP